MEFSTCENEAADERLRECVRRAARAAVEAVGEDKLEAVILTGTLSRGEATAVVQADGTVFSFSDAEFLVVCREGGVRKGAAGKLAEAARGVEEALRGEGVSIEVDMRPVVRRELRRLRRRIFTLELRTHGKAVWGDEGVVECVPVVDPRRILRWDAVSLVFNRIIEHLEARGVVATAGPQERAILRYRNAKTLLDMAGSLLAFQGHYEPTYRARGEKFGAFYETLPDLRRQLPEMAQEVRRWTRYKLDPESFVMEDGGGTGEGDATREVRREWHRTARIVREVWLWESQRFLGAPGVDDPYEMAERYLRTDMIGMKVKGWVGLMMKERGRREVPWGRALRLMSLARPNTLIYASGAILYFALSRESGLERVKELEHAAAVVDRFLPAPPEEWEDPREMVAAVVRNWKWFVK